jgi:hypothetical protein
MRLIPLVSAVILSVAAPSFAQDWIEYYSKADRFLVNFPGQPQVREVPYPTEYGLTLSARLHVYEDGPSRYAVTVVDYTNVGQLHAARVKGCTAYPDTCTNRGPNEVRGALDYAAWNFIKRDARVTYYAFGDSDRIEGLRIQLLNPDRSRTFGAIYMHENRLYILEATVPPNAPPPALFQQNLGFLDQDGRRVRYDTIYSNQYAAPPRIPAEGRLQGCE